MRWFMHPVDLSTHPAVSLVRSEFGNHGYGAICRIMEEVAGSWNIKEGESSRMPRLALPKKDWQQITEFSPKKFQKFLEICQKSSFFSIENEGKLISIEVTILLKLLDEYSKKQLRKSGVNPDNLLTISAVQQQEKPEEKIRQQRQGATSENKKAIREVLRRHGIDPDSRRGESCMAHALEKATDNPAGYLVGTLGKNADFGKDAEWSSGERHYGTKSTGEILANLNLPFPIKQKE